MPTPRTDTVSQSTQSLKPGGTPSRAPSPYAEPNRPRMRFRGPLISTIDKYVLKSFLKNYLISLFVLIGLYVVLDMVFNFDEFVQVSGSGNAEEAFTIFQTLKLIAFYYTYQAFRIFSYLAGVIPVVATAFTLMRMSRFNELAALLAAGIPLGRVAAPIIIASLVINNALLFVNQEFVVPSMIEELSKDRGELESGLENRVLRAMPDGPHGILFAGRYMPHRADAPATMEVVDLFNITDDVTTHLTANKAIYDQKTDDWFLEGGEIVNITESSGVRGKPTVVEKLTDTTVNPETIALFISRGEFVDMLSTTRINQLLATRATVGRVDLMRVRDSRWANYMLNVILVLLTIPCVLTREPTQLRTASARVFMLVGLCMATIFITQNLAGQPPANPQLAARWPGIMAITPIAIFGSLSIWLLDRLKS